MAGRTVSLFLVAHDRMTKTLARAGDSTDKLGKRIQLLQKLAAAPGGIAALTGSVTSLGAALAPATAAVAALPAAMAATKAATATLKIGLHGVSDALDAVANQDTDKLEKSLAKMTPSARAFVKEAAKFNEALSPIRTAVQEKLFSGLSKSLGDAAKAQMPGLTKGMTGVAGSFNKVGKEVGKFAQTSKAQEGVNKVFGLTKGVMDQVAKATQPVLKGLVDLVIAGIPFTKQLATWVINGAKTAGAFFSSERGARSLKDALNGAKETLASLGRIGKNIGSILSGVFKNAGENGTGLLDTIEKLTAEAAAWVKSSQGQEKISETFALLRDVMSSLREILPFIVGPLGAIATVLTSLPAPTADVAAKILAFGLVAGLLGGKLIGLTKLLFGFGKGIVTVVGGVAKGTAAAAKGVAGFAGGLAKGTAGLNANSGAAAKAGAAVRKFGSTMSTGIQYTAQLVTRMSALAWEKGKVAAQAAIATTRTVALTVAQKASAVAAKAMAVATRLVNAAMRANPIGIIITILIALGAAIVLAYKKSETFRTIVNRVWASIKSAISVAWNNVIKPALTALRNFLVNTVAPKITWFYTNVIKPVWNNVGSAIRTVWTKFISPAFTAIKTGIGKVGDAFRNGVEFIKKAWKKIEGAAKAPVRFVVDTVLNNGILKAWNFVADKFGLSPKNLRVDLPKGFARGGILPGYSREDDQLIMARSGEGILVPEAVKSLGERFIHRANSLKGNAAKLLGAAGDPGGLGIPGFAEGGIVGGLKAFFGKAKDWFMDGVKSATKLVTEPILSSLEGAMGGSTYGKMLAGIPRRMVNSFLNWIDGKENAISGGAGGGAGGKAVAAARSQIGVPYSWGGGGPGGPSYGIGRGAGTRGFDCSGLTEYAWWKATGKSIGGVTYTQKNILKRVGTPRPGDVGQPHPGHTYLMSGPGKIIEAPFTGGFVREVPMRSTGWWGRPPWVMDTGGVLAPGMNPPIFNGTGGPEYVLRPDQLAAVAGAGGDINIHIHGATDPLATAREIEKVLKKLKRTNGRMPLGIG